MQFNTVLKVGGLAFDVAQDEKVRELVTMVHKGAKRRGLIGPMVPQAAPTPVTNDTAAKKESEGHPIPFSPSSSTEHAPSPSASGGLDISKYLNAGNAKKALSVAGQLSQLLMK